MGIPVVCIFTMSEYTIVNFIPKNESAEQFIESIKLSTNSQFVRNRCNDSVVLMRFGGDKRTEVYNNLISEDEGNLIYDIPIDLRITEETVIGHLIINYFEDTGDHHESELYRVTAFNTAEKIDEVVIYDDLTGSAVEQYYSSEHNLVTDISPP